MIDLGRIVGFDWDSGNVRKNEKHDVSQSEAEQIFFDGKLLTVTDAGHSRIEPRYHMLGTTIDGRHLHVTFTLRAEESLIRVISARDMHRRERQVYERKD